MSERRVPDIVAVHGCARSGGRGVCSEAHTRITCDLFHHEPRHLNSVFESLWYQLTLNLSLACFPHSWQMPSQCSELSTLNFLFHVRTQQQDHMATLFLVFWGTFILFSIEASQFTFAPKCRRVPFSPYDPEIICLDQSIILWVCVQTKV